MTPLLGAIADDFTGATDLANMLARAGMRTILVLGQPAPEDPLPEIRLDANAVDRLDQRLAVRKLFLQVAVRLVFIPQATHQPAAPPADLLRVQRVLLHLRRTHRDGLEHLEELPAAAVLAARSCRNGRTTRDADACSGCCS